MADPAFKDITDWLGDRRRPLVLTHQRPDGDAVGSLAAMAHALNAAGLESVPYMPEPVPDRYRPYVSDGFVVHGSDPKIERCDAVVCVDTAHPKLAAQPLDKPVLGLELPVCNIDHHADNAAYGSLNIVIPERASTTELLAIMFRDAGVGVSPESASLLLIGLVMDTGGFRFSNCTATSLNTAAWLMERGADYNRIMLDMFFNDPLKRLQLKAKVIDALVFASDNRMAYVLITDALLQSCGAAESDTEGLIDAIRTIQGVDIFALLHEADGDVRISLRSRNTDVTVNDIARQLGGGGHLFAAGATISNSSIEDAASRLVSIAGEKFDGQ